MVTYGGFRDSAALARWSETAEAQPVLRRWREWRCSREPGEYFSVSTIDSAAEDAAMEALAAKIEAEFGAS